jgi:hypothetical protein
MRATSIVLVLFIVIGALAAFTGAAALRPDLADVITGTPPVASPDTTVPDAQASPAVTAAPTEVSAPTRTPAKATATAKGRPSPTATPIPSPSPTPLPAASTFDPWTNEKWKDAIHSEDGGIYGMVTADLLNVRTAPQLNAPAVRTTYKRHPIVIYDTVSGDPVDGIQAWYRVGDGEFITAAFVEPFIAPAPATTYDGHWVDVNLTSFYAIAYDGDVPVHAAIIIAGQEREGTRTPVGEFRIQRRVQNETMDAATLGIKKEDPDYYLLPNVKWTQYFAPDGVALHTNYWSDPSQYGGRGSHGCVNLMESDAYFFWNFVTFGSPVSVHL